MRSVGDKESWQASSTTGASIPFALLEAFLLGGDAPPFLVLTNKVTAIVKTGFLGDVVQVEIRIEK